MAPNAFFFYFTFPSVFNKPFVHANNLQSYKHQKHLPETPRFPAIISMTHACYRNYHNKYKFPSGHACPLKSYLRIVTLFR